MTELESAFFGFITEYGKSYPSMEEYTMRFEQFSRAHHEIVAHNMSDSSFQLGHNQMSDWTEAEYLAILTHEPMLESEKNYEYHPEVGAGHVDWRNSGKVNAIKDQKQCGSCWAFSSACALESAWAINKGHLYSLSEQQLVDCEPKSHGCNGGRQDWAFTYYKTHNAIEEREYGYTARTGSC
jgi:C1A family cysteine protease